MPDYEGPMSVDPVRPKLPPLNALRAFEAAARLGGFTSGAQELCVTPAAVAQQVKVLEDWLGSKLFQRQAQGIELTPVGARCFRALEPALDQLGMAVSEMRVAARPNQIHIAALPSIAQLWLSPRLPDIRRRMPNVNISITAMEQPPNFDREQFDLGLFFFDVPQGIVLLRDRIFPVAAPNIANSIHRIADLDGVTCLLDSTWDQDWTNWLSANGAPHHRVMGSVYSLYALAVTEAVHGAGVLMGHACLIQEQLAARSLVPVLGGRAQPSLSLCALTPQKRAPNPLLNSVLRLLQG